MIYIKENRGGRVRVSVGSTFTMKDNASVFGNTANSATNANWGHEGGGVFVDYSGAFRFAGGTIYGSNVMKNSKTQPKKDMHCMYQTGVKTTLLPGAPVAWVMILKPLPIA